MKTNWENREFSTDEKSFKKATVQSFIVFSLLFLAGGIAWLWLYQQPKTADNVQPALRAGYVANERLFSKFYSASKESKSFTKEEAVKKVRVNGNVGVGNDFKPDNWILKVAKKPGDTLLITLDDIKALHKTEVIFDFKCVEGWSQVTWWGGVRFGDFLKKYNLAAQSAMNYCGMVTPDGKYYVGNDLPSMLQPQTLLCYEMNGKSLPNNQGYPLRLIIPVKYGIKHLKRIGIIFFSNEKPRDYWAEQGYDYYSGL